MMFISQFIVCLNPQPFHSNSSANGWILEREVSKLLNSFLSEIYMLPILGCVWSGF